jgi:hypothetical protein
MFIRTFSSHWPILSPSTLLTFSPESPCIWYGQPVDRDKGATVLKWLEYFNMVLQRLSFGAKWTPRVWPVHRLRTFSELRKFRTEVCSEVSPSIRSYSVLASCCVVAVLCSVMAALRACSHNKLIPCVTRTGFKTGFHNYSAKEKVCFAKMWPLSVETSEIIARSFIF